MLYEEFIMQHHIKDDSFHIAALQEKMLELLEELIRFCEENGLTYYACGGTCIGAIRHDGFIPWDDDLDVFMPRADYEKLWTLRDKFDKERYKLCRSTLEKNYHHRVMQLVDLNTTFINRRSVNEDIEHGVYIDILPMDVCASGGFGYFRQKVLSILYSVYNVQCLPEFHGGKFFRLAVGFLLKVVPDKKKRYNIWSKCEKKMTRYQPDDSPRLVELTAALKELRHPYPKEWFSSVIKHKFEDIEINIPVGYDNYLRQVFGDYMALPDLSEQRPRHNTVFVDLNNSYKKYKGIYYCVDKKV